MWEIKLSLWKQWEENPTSHSIRTNTIIATKLSTTRTGISVWPDAITPYTSTTSLPLWTKENQIGDRVAAGAR